ncbi:hypothetical protein Syun_004428 [Stephania yunnanensis]|uniref:Uncharacterized protein n=1 Tax=Stephania yunnanensis TaxID=152371 RepID=A0AAP0Q4Y1_9MAGN
MATSSMATTHPRVLQWRPHPRVHQWRPHPRVLQWPPHPRVLLLHLRVAFAVFFIVASRPPSSPKQQGVHQDPQEERVAIEARKKASQRIVESRPPSSPNEQGLDQPILPLLPLRPITGHRFRFLLLHLLEQIRLLHRRVATAVFAEITGTRSRPARTGSRNRNAEEGIATAATPLLPLRPITGHP